MPSRPPGFSPHATVEQALLLRDQPLACLTSLVAGVRPSNPEDADRRIISLCHALEDHPAAGAAIGGLIRQLVADSNVIPALTESGLDTDRGLYAEVARRVGRRLLPEVDEPGDLRTFIRAVFSKGDDYRWLAAISPHAWRRVLDVLGFTQDVAFGVPEDLVSSVRVLAHHIASAGLSPEIVHRMPDLDDLTSPFLVLSEQALGATQDMAANAQMCAVRRGETLATLRKCSEAIAYLRANKHIFGTSLRLTKLSFRLSELVRRLELLMVLLPPVEEPAAVQQALVRLVVDLTEAENTRNHVIRALRESGDLVAFQIVEHAAKKGTKYITENSQEYWRFLRASMLGGVIVAFFALGKQWLYHLEMSKAGEAFWFSVNYAACFMCIYLFGGALATKQPAATANTIVRDLDMAKGGSDDAQLQAVADMVVSVWRSQFISFVGNLICAFPVAIGLVVAWDSLMATPMVLPGGELKLLKGVAPFTEPTLLFAAIAGLFLFMGGIVAGHFDNRNVYRHLSRRVEHHPGLRRWLGERRSASMGRFIDKHGGALSSNIFLGFCLGSTAAISGFFGLSLDIRHIAFASANVGMAWEAAGFSLPVDVLATAGLGVILIGLFNFLVSFGLTMGMALESRRTSLRHDLRLLKLVGLRLVRTPWRFFWPPREQAAGAGETPAG